jgi:hypothetical protein
MIAFPPDQENDHGRHDIAKPQAIVDDLRNGFRSLR